MDGNTQEQQVSPKMDDGKEEHVAVGIAKREARKTINRMRHSVKASIHDVHKCAPPELVVAFERELYGNWAFYENKYFDQDKLKRRITELTGYFDYLELREEVDDYINQAVYYLALLEYIRAFGDEYE